MSSIIKVRNREHLEELVQCHVRQYGPTCDLNHLDVSGVTNMTNIFQTGRFNGDISRWDVSNVENMAYMFARSQFNGDISKWNTSKVTNMCSLFANSVFNGDISEWDTSNVVDMSYMFHGARFQGNISKWNTSKVEDMLGIFSRHDLKSDICGWNLDALDPHRSLDLFSTFHESPLGYLGVLQGIYDLPDDYPHTAQFDELMSLCEGLNVDILGAAKYIYQEINQPSATVQLSVVDLSI